MPLLQVRQPGMELGSTGAQVINAIVRMLQDEDAARAKGS